MDTSGSHVHRDHTRLRAPGERAVRRWPHQRPSPVRGDPAARIPGQGTNRPQYVHRLRGAFPRQDPPRRKPSVRDVTRRITRHPDRLDADDAQRLKEILARWPPPATTADHVRAFAELMNSRRGQRLKDWIAAVQTGQVPALTAFATGLLQDLDAVVAGLSLRYSSGAVEGHRKIKMLKRQMFDRAGFDLLRLRVLHAT
ncbi:transposase [Streptomyces chartreusis]|uniref:transposase n=1 Tax=Streptomyces chartreusis TaxID=1969 RepID=UPI0036A95F01